MEDMPFKEMPPEEGMWDTGGILSPFQPTVHENVIGVLSKINIQANDVLVDLGCGDGRVLFHSAFLGCQKSIGIELNKELSDEVQRKIEELGLESSVSVLCEDFLSSDLRDATIIYVYLLPEALIKLKEKFEKAFEGKTRVIISTHFSIPWWQGEKFMNCWIYYPDCARSEANQ